MKMRWTASLAGVACLAALSGCSRIEQGWMPVVDKINAAYPLPPEVDVAQRQLVDMLADQPEPARLFKAQWTARLTLRALGCSKDRPVGRLASVDDVRAMRLDAACFQEQDKALQDMLGARTVGLLMSQPAVAPLKALGPFQALPLGETQGFRGIAGAAQANALAVQGGDGVVRIVTLPEGKPLSTLPGPEAGYGGELALSPNGRVLALRREGKLVQFHDTRNGRKIWELGGMNRLVAWLPEVKGLILQSAQREGWVLVDAESGEQKPHPLNLRSRSQALTLPGAPSRLIAVGNREFELIEHKREPEGLTASMLQQWSLGQEVPYVSSSPILMRGGKLLAFGCGDGIGWLDLTSGHSGKWGPLPQFRGNLLRLDGTHLMFQMREPGTGQEGAWSFDVDAATLAPVAAEDLHRGGLTGLQGRDGGVVWGSEQLWVGGQAATTGQPMSMDAVIADANLKIQLAKLAMAEAQEKAAAEEEARARAMARDGLPDVSPGAVVHTIGVYEASGPVRVTVRGATRPVVLVLASYESVNWTVSDPERKVAAVLLSGYKPSTVDVSGGPRRVLRIGSASAYQAGSREHRELLQAVRQYTGGRDIRSFQGGYRGVEFSVGP